MNYNRFKIPHLKEPLRYEERAFCDSEFAELVSNEKIDICMQYPLLGMKNAQAQCLLRKEAARRLLEASDKLPKGYRFRIWDAWRPFALQHELFVVYSGDIIRTFHLEEATDEERSAVIRGFVSDSVEDRELPPVHTTGGAVDLTILDDKGEELDMGTGFDAFTDRTRTDYYEPVNAQKYDGNPEDIRKIRANRRLLYQIMTQAGFTNLPSEWWHYDYGDRFWAYYMGRTAIYRGVFTKEELNSNDKTD